MMGDRRVDLENDRSRTLRQSLVLRPIGKCTQNTTSAMRK
jgi:hypothetical protein